MKIGSVKLRQKTGHLNLPTERPYIGGFRSPFVQPADSAPMGSGCLQSMQRNFRPTVSFTSMSFLACWHFAQTVGAD
jgi:hypothetical protein